MKCTALCCSDSLVSPPASAITSHCLQQTKLPGVTVKPMNPSIRALGCCHHLLVSHETSLSSCFSIYFRDYVPKQASLRSTFWPKSVLNFIPYSYSFQQRSNQPPLHPGKKQPQNIHPTNLFAHLPILHHPGDHSC